VKHRATWIAGILLVAGCQTMNAGGDVPALITGPDDKSHADLKAALAAAFGGLDVVFADDALTQTSLLTIERGPHRTINNPSPGGRILADPFRFKLVKSGEDCVLVDLRDDSRHVLADTSCVPEQ
jgi:hypothetical protein